MLAHPAQASNLRTIPGHVSQAFGWAGLLRHMLIMVETRLQLQELDEHLLRDIGVTRHGAQREARRAPWDIGPDGKPRPGF
ncbi:DUF1127 domain-containing protein [Roseomonas marmotae]|uniref:DUF1127 domain-containing protein n=1 Tax=Roseomonas marmotae TaxID=2768161 RepID=A0ABS3KDN0_9PROT|nr:DUF1127 domain-containing protein [Roseomonas marmotae]MBO1075563.1 DUF1127 domain-containing protein [Roseomonas marmotae]QTI79429.1 DUF1127 domain-containing protein [Roseomonas marmotae]